MISTDKNEREHGKFRETVNGHIAVATIEHEVTPDDEAKINSSVVLGYDGFGNLETITETISGVQYRKTLSYDGSSNLTGVSAWVKL